MKKKHGISRGINISKIYIYSSIFMVPMLCSWEEQFEMREKGVMRRRE